MPRLRTLLFAAFAFLLLDLVAATPAAAQGRSRRAHQILAANRSAERSDDERIGRRGGSNEDSDEDSEDSDRGRDDDDRGRRDRCVDVDRDGRCDSDASGRYPDARYPTGRYPDRSGSPTCTDRNRDGQCDRRGGILRRMPPLSQLSALIFGQ